MSPTVKEIRCALLAATANIPVASEYGESTPANTFAPASHIKALRPQTSLVVGARGVGKTFWTQALQDKNIRRMLSQDIPEFENTRVTVGYGNANIPELYPSTNTFSTLLKEYAPSDIWRAIIVHAVASHSDMSDCTPPFAHGEWADDVKAVQSSPEKIDEFLHDANKKLEKSNICLLILFDALDRVAESWKDIDVLTTALLRIALQFSTYSSLKIKIFLREDHYNRLSFSFPDSSKLLSYKIELTWNRAELYSLLWKQLYNAPNEYGETLRALFNSKIHEILEEEDGVWQFRSDAQLNDEKLRPLVHELTGPYMGKDQRRGIPYIWIVGHLADARLQTTPRSFLVAIRRACEDSLKNHADSEYPIHFESIKRGVQSASEIRVNEMKEDNPWAAALLSLLKGMNVPCSFSEIEEVWQKEYPQGPSMLLEEDKQHTPPEFAVGNWDNVRKILEKLGFCNSLQDERFHMPDIYRIGFRLGRKGGVKPLRS